jgi:hypothetical protein
MTARERQDLARLVRQRAKVEKAGAAQRRAEIMADFEQQLASIYTPDDDAAWKAMHEAAEQATTEANAAIAERCAELGIPKQFRPSISTYWYGRGENALKDRRAELRRVAVTRLDALEKAARTEIERASVEAQTALVADGLTTEKARTFLEALPSIGALMPALDVSEIRGLLGNGGR